MNFIHNQSFYLPMNYIKIAYILGSGTKGKDMVMVNFISLTKVHTLDNLIMEKLKEKEGCSIPMAIFI